MLKLPGSDAEKMFLHLRNRENCNMNFSFSERHLVSGTWEFRKNKDFCY